MLLQFSVKNFLSFKDEVILNMVPAKSRVMQDHIIFDKRGKLTNALPVATIFGANASGKTNLIKAVSFAKNLISEGTRPDNITGVIPHLLDPKVEKEPSHFEFIFKHDGILYTYGFTASTNTIYKEWLFAYYTSRESVIFKRITTNNQTEVELGLKLIKDIKTTKLSKNSNNKITPEGFLRYVAAGTRPNQLFLTEAAKGKNIELLKPVTDWFQNHLHILDHTPQLHTLALHAHKNKDFIPYLAKFVSQADTGINNIQFESEDFDINKHLATTPEKLRQKIVEDIANNIFKKAMLQKPGELAFISKENKATKYLCLKTEHKKTDNTIATFDISDESDGTRRFMELVLILKNIFAEDSVYIIDELDRSLHTFLSRLFIQLCVSDITEGKPHGQFITTTHDTNLLDRKLLRRDEIWFMEKDKFGASHLTSLAEYKISDGLNYENGYLNGRFGAIPFVGKIKNLLR